MPVKTILVTGGAGFIGSNFVRHALAQGAEHVVVLDALTYAGSRRSLVDVEADPRFHFVEGDIADRNVVDAVYREHRPTWVVNFAAESHVDRSIDGPRIFVRTNVLGVFEMLDGARQFHAELSGEARAAFRFLQVSTDEVYGSLGDTGTFHETTPYAPNSPYAASKAGGDHLVGAYHSTFGLPVLITNCSNNYGPFQFPEKLIPLVILNALDGRDLPIYGDGQNVRDWLYVGDHCEGIWRVLEAGRLGEKYNIGGNSERTNLQTVDAICAALDELAPVAENPAAKARQITRYGELKTFVSDRPGHDRRYAIDAGKIGAELGWNPRHGFDAGIRSTVQWYLDNSDWCADVRAGRYRGERLGLGKDGQP